MAGLKAPTLDDAALNANGTYDGAKALSWVSEAIHPGHGVPVAEVKSIWDEVQQRMANEVAVELEPQPHGGALQRQHAPDDLPRDPEYESLQDRQDRRVDGIPAIYRTTFERLACELAMARALAEEPEDVFARYKYTPEEALVLLESPAFAALLDRVTKEVREGGLTFRAKAKLISEDLLTHAYDLATDPLVSSAVRADLIKWSAKVSGNEPREKELPGGAGGLNLSITFAGQAPVKVVSHEPALIEQEG